MCDQWLSYWTAQREHFHQHRNFYQTALMMHYKRSPQSLSKEIQGIWVAQQTPRESMSSVILQPAWIWPWLEAPAVTFRFHVFSTPQPNYLPDSAPTRLPPPIQGAAGGQALWAVSFLGNLPPQTHSPGLPPSPPEPLLIRESRNLVIPVVSKCCATIRLHRSSLQRYKATFPLALFERISATRTLIHL